MFIRTIKATLKEPFGAPWCSGYHYCTIFFKKVWTQLRFCRDSNPARDVSGDCNGENLAIVRARNEATITFIVIKHS